MKKSVFKILHILILILTSVLLIGSFYIKKFYPNEGFDVLYFYLINGVENSDPKVFIDAIISSAPYFLIVVFLLISLFYDIFKIGKITKNKIYPFKLFVKHKIIFTILIFIISILIGLYNIKFFSFLNKSFNDSKFIENYYVDPKGVNIKFKEKRNLIFIMVESLETSLFKKEVGGNWDSHIIPELYDLLSEEDSIYFSTGENSEGQYNLDGAHYTTASIVTNSSGIVFKLPLNGIMYTEDNFLNGVYSLGDLLKDNGYTNELISAADTDFGGVEAYFTKHGNYNILDSRNVESLGYELKDEDRGSWGFNDRYLFSLAKKRLYELAKNDKPFNLNLITIDTHFPGAEYDYTIKEFDDKLLNSYRTTSYLLYDFISWVKKQDFYDNTTIVVIGDHPNMQLKLFLKINAKKRLRYNVIINSSVTTENTKNRSFTAVDTYPTIISSIGGVIEGEQLGLGINLFSKKQTLSERFHHSYFKTELSKNSKFYNDFIMKD